MQIACVAHNSIKHDARVLKGAASLKAQGHDVYIFGLTSEETEDFLLPNGIPVHLQHRDLSDIKPRIAREGLRPGKENSIWTSFRIQGETVFESVKSHMQPDIVHLHDHLTLTASAKYKESFDCPLVWDAHEIYDDLANIETVRAEVNSNIIETNSHNVDRFITLNESIANYYETKYPNLPKAVLIPNAVQNRTLPDYDGRMHSAAGLLPDQKILLYQGGYSPHRGIQALLETSRYLSERWTLVFMGWGKLAEEIGTYASEETDRPRGRPRIAMIPSVSQEELLHWTTGATLGTIPYENTGLNHLYCSPNKLWEYPAAGVPILATDLPEMAKRIRRYGIGITTPRELEPKIIADAVNLISDSTLSAMKTNCSKFTELEDWNRYEKKLIRLYAHLGVPPETRAPRWREKAASIISKFTTQK